MTKLNSYSGLTRTFLVASNLLTMEKAGIPQKKKKAAAPA